jgi:hypothetical protein
MSALPDRHHGGDRLHRATRDLPASAGYIMSPSRRFHRAKPSHPRDRVADAWAAWVIQEPALRQTGQIQTRLTTWDGLVGLPHDCDRWERLDGISFQRGRGH